MILSSHDSIRLGIFLGRKFDLPPDVEIVEYPPDVGTEVAVPFQKGSVIEVDLVELKKIGYHYAGIYVWAGYSERSKTLCLKEEKSE